MDELLAQVLRAHGGLDNWATVTTITAQFSLDGPFWDWRGQPGIRQPQTATLDTRREHITLTPSVGDRLTSVYDGATGRAQLLDADGRLLEERDDPMASFPAYTDTVGWDRLHVAAFTGYANWNYLTMPFLFTYPGFEAHEIAPWQEDGQTWRRLEVTFPATYTSHNPRQTFYVDENFLLRRMDYAPAVTGSSPIAHYLHDPKTFDGFVFYARRLVHPRDAQGNADQNFTIISIATDSVRIDRE